MSIIHDKFDTETNVKEYWLILFNIYVYTYIACLFKTGNICINIT